MTDEHWQLLTRAYLIRAYIPPSENREVFIKREDELSSGVSGSKYRKFASLIPYLLHGGYDEVLAIGSAYSNNILAALQLLREHGIPLRLLMLESNQSKPSGNELWIKLLTGDFDVQWITRADWYEADAIADKYAEEQAAAGRRIFILREGSAVAEAMPGAMTLADDILRNEKELRTSFRHIFMDSGTGASAIGLILGLERSGSTDKALHITLIAGAKESFLEKLAYLRRLTESLIHIPLPDRKIELHFYKPITSASFGSLNRIVIEETKAIAVAEGILMEPVYSVKHLYTAKKIILEQNLSGSILFVYNGGSLGLAGYQEKLI